MIATIDAFVPPGRCVASAYAKPVTRNKKPTHAWKDTRDCGGQYDRLEDWMRHIQLEHPKMAVFFKLRSDL